MFYWIVATFAAFFIKGLCGFANTLVFTSILGFVEANVSISPVELMLGLPSNVILTYKNRKNLKPSVFVPLALLVLAGSIPGAFLLINLNVQYLKIICGMAIVLIGIEMLYREYHKSQIKESRIVLGIIGLASGILCGLFGIGALLAAYVGRVTKNTEEFKANISAVFIVENIFRVIVYSIIGVINYYSLTSALVLVPAMLIALFLGIKSAQILDEKVIKKLVIILLIISGLILAISNI